MLALTFETGEVVVIGQEICVQIGIKEGDRRKLIITAPASIGVKRGELDGPVTNTIVKDYGNLVLSRKKDETIDFEVAGQLIGQIHVISNRPNRVRLAFEFYDEIDIRRESVFCEDFANADPSIFENPTARELLQKAAA